MRRGRRSVALGGAAAAALALAGCASAQPAAEEGGPVVLAAFYPLEFVAQRIGGEGVEVRPLTPPGAEPHDLELSPAQVRQVGEADVVVYLQGFQPAVDEAVAARRPAHVVDAAEVIGIHVEEHHHDHGHSDDDHDEDHDEGHAHEDDAHEDDDHGHDDDDHGHDDEHHDEDHGHEDHRPEEDGANHAHEGDPHFWLDPTLLAELAEPVAEALAASDPDRADQYHAAAELLVADLHGLDERFVAGLATCSRDLVVVQHEAFGFLTERYGLRQLGLSGIDPEAEPSPARLREIRAQVADEDVTTIFTETLVNPRAAEVLAADLGLTTALLDPIESRADSQTDYLGAMEANLAALTAALDCRE